MEAIARLARCRHAYHSTLRLPQVTAVIAASDLFVGNDSGLAHIAAAVNTRMVVLWGSANLNMARPHSSAERCSILYHELPCREACLEFKCTNPYQHECLLRTEMTDVLEAARHHLQRAGK